MEGWRDQGKWLLRPEDFAALPVDDSLDSMLTALVRVAQSKHQREVSSCGGESREPAAMTSTGAPRKGEIRERPRGSNKLDIGNPGRAGGKGKAMEETLSGGDVQRRSRPWKEVAEEGIGFAIESRGREWSLGEEKSCGARRKVCLTPKAREGSSKKSEGSPPAPSGRPADMPQEFKDRIDCMGGKEVKLVIEKELSRTDLDRHICRLSIPKNQVRDPSFLREEEARVVKVQNAIDVSVIGPKQKGVLKFALLEMGGRNKERPSLIYIFRSGWNNFALENKLRTGDRIQIWSFRADSHDCRDRLCFALVNLDDRQNGGDVGAGHGSDDNSNGSGPSSVPGGSSSEHGSTSNPERD